MTGVCLWPFNWTSRQTHWWRAPRDADPPLWCCLSRSCPHARLSVRGRDTRRRASYKASCLYDRVIDHWWETWKAQFPVVFCPRFYLTDWCQIFFRMVTQACSFDQWTSDVGKNWSIYFFTHSVSLMLWDTQTDIDPLILQLIQGIQRKKNTMLQCKLNNIEEVINGTVHIHRLL